MTTNKDNSGRMEGTLSPPRAVAYIEREWGLRVAPSTIRRWAKSGAIAAKQGEHGRLYIRPAALRRVFGP